MNVEKKKCKKRLLKKVPAVLLAVITAFSILPAADLTTVKAAKPYVSLRTAFKTLAVGQTNRMTLKNNSINWKISKVATNDRTIAMVYDRTESSFMIKGKSAGRTTIKARLKTAARKKQNVKTVRCRVNVIAQEDRTEAVVSDQAGLEKALQSKNLKKLEINTNQTGRLTIPKGTYSDTELTVYAPAADIENNGIFKSITIQAVKPDTWIENAIGNIMRITASAARIIVNQGARLNKLTFACTDAKVRLEVNGTIGELTISTKMELSISGKPEAPIPAVIEESAEGTTLETSAPLQVIAHASANITFNEGSENSSVEIKSDKAKVNVTNNTNSTLTIIKADGTVERKAPVKVSMSSRPSGNASGPSAETRPVTPSVITTTGGSIEINPGEEEPGSSWYPGTGSSGETGVFYEPYPSAKDFLNILNPSLTITCSAITCSAISASPAEIDDSSGASEAGTVTVTMESMLTLDIKPNVIEDDDVEISLLCNEIKDENEKLVFDNMVLNEPKKITLSLPEYAPEPISLTDLDDNGINFYIRFSSKTSTGTNYREIWLQIYSKEALKKTILDMQEKNISVRTLSIPCYHNYSITDNMWTAEITYDDYDLTNEEYFHDLPDNDLTDSEPTDEE